MIRHVFRMALLALAAALPVLAPLQTASAASNAFSTALGDHSFSQISVDTSGSQTAYAAGNDGSNNPYVFKSTNQGGAWTQMTNGMAGPMTVYSMAVSASSPQTVYVGGYNPNAGSAQLWRSTDGGGSWAAATNGLGTASVQSLAIDPNSSTIVYAGTNKGMFKSTDGMTFTQLSGMGTRNIQALTMDRSNPSNLYAGTHPNTDGGVWRSGDGGSTWSEQNNGLPAGNGVFKLAVAPNAASTLFAAVGTDPNGTRLYKSADGSSSWANLNVNGSVTGMAVSPLNAGMMFYSGSNGLFRTTDGGANFMQVGGYGNAPVGVDNNQPQTLYVGGTGITSYTGDLSALQAAANTATAMAHDQRYFAQTGFRIDNDVFWDYFNRRGGLDTFGYPTSRMFLFRGFQVQFFQRRIMEMGPNGQARLLNVLDPGLLAFNQFNGSSFPAFDSAMMSTAPDPTNQPATLAWVQQHAPDTMAGAAVNFYQTFQNTVAAQIAFPNGGNANLLPGIQLEMWGTPTSAPAMDPNNHNFIYQRWQRGVMHFDATCNCTRGILLADYLKDILTGQNLPSDVAQEASGSPLLNQVDPSQPHWVHNPSLLPNTDFTNAFVAG